MNIFDIILIGIALSMDAFAVCLSSGIVYADMKKSDKILMPVLFSVFQGIMPVLGYFTGDLFKNAVGRRSGVICFVILGFIGFNMIKEGISGEESNELKNFTVKLLIMQAVATSIDAFGAGISFAAKGNEILTASAVISVSTLIICSAGVFIGSKMGEHFGGKTEIIGGIILIFIGIKSLL